MKRQLKSIIVEQENTDYMKASMLDKFISKIYIAYLEFVSKTSKISITGEINDEILDNSIVAFCHGDSYGINLLLKEIRAKNRKINIVVTKDKRGNFIEEMLNNYGAIALRMPDGVKMKSFLRELKNVSKEDNNTVCIALDGPLGPYKDPKKVAFVLSNDSNKPCILVSSSFSKKISLNNRWDKYIIPLPFSKIEFKLNNIGIISSDNIRNFREYKKEIISLIK